MQAVGTRLHYERAKVALWRYKLDKPVGGSGVATVDIISVELMAEGITGMGFSYVLNGGGEAAFRLACTLLDRIVKTPVLPPAALWRRLNAQLGSQAVGAGRIGIAAIDVAAWDLQAKLLDVPLYTALGGEARAIPLYGSGFRAGQAEQAAIEAAQAYAAAGLQAVKLRVIGGASDVQLLSAVSAAHPDLQLMVDANERCNLVSAASLFALCREHAVLFIEEPLPAYELDAYAQLARLGGPPIASGEHLQGAQALKPFLDRDVLTLVQPDLAMAGGISGCLRMLTLAEHYGRPASPHFLPDLFVHVAAAAPNVAWLEHFPLLEPLFSDILPIGPTLMPPDRPGHGLSWAADISSRVETIAKETSA